jgi:hypothetical protein
MRRLRRDTNKINMLRVLSEVAHKISLNQIRSYAGWSETISHIKATAAFLS